ncbi:hypothetical protein NDU88_002665 [Pleurodeles waltl]|uniref:C2H2-type domain-containing protein n=1 Tax=Pleurodeles waltl TaxID=8319 RepID=A0AAV7KTG4_PLEWA|nr:hypothetical protein NDU88_002665 [Pleurodeles waltl]
MAAACVPTTKRASKSGSPRVRADFSCEHWEIVKPSVTDLTREGRSNILCTVKGCGKVLSNPPALNMHLVKSHGVQEGLINPTVRKVLKPHSQRLYCCPIEGCPRGPNRPFSQFSLVKQHFMKMHAEKKYKCEKCNNSYSTEGDLKRHAICCGKTFQCTCGCPYASRTALLSHIYRTGHEIPDEHRDPPVKKRKMEEFMQSYNISDKQSELFNQEVLHNDVAQKYSSPSFTPLVTFSDLSSTCVIEQALGHSSYTAATQTSFSQETLSAENVDQRFLQSNLFRDVSSCTVKSETSLTENRLIGVNVDQNFLETSEIREVDSHNVKSEPFINFTAQKDALPQQNMTDSQTQTMDLLSDLENILSDNLSNQTLDNRSLLSEANAAGEMHLSSGSAPHGGIDFDIEEFFSASNIQTQTDESDLGNVNAESLDIETQTDFFSSSSTLRGNANFLAMFDTQTQTDLNFFLDHSAPLPIGNILKEASFSVSTDSSDNETQTDLTSAGKLASTLSLENQVQLNSAETQTIDSCLDTLGSLFLTSNETQTAMDDFLLADLAWNTMESQFSSVETQTCKELLSLFQTSDNLGD